MQIRCGSQLPDGFKCSRLLRTCCAIWCHARRLEGPSQLHRFGAADVGGRLKTLAFLQFYPSAIRFGLLFDTRSVFENGDEGTRTTAMIRHTISSFQSVFEFICLN